MKTSGGKYIAPQPIESAIKQSRFVNQVVVIGDERKFPAALIVPRMDQLVRYAKHKAIAYGDPAQLLEHPRIIDLFQRQVEKYTQELSQYEKDQSDGAAGKRIDSRIRRTDSHTQSAPSGSYRQIQGCDRAAICRKVARLRAKVSKKWISSSLIEVQRRRHTGLWPSCGSA